jgi:hypothetical protein
MAYIHFMVFHTDLMRSVTACEGVIPIKFLYWDNYCFTPGGQDQVLWPYTVVCTH